MRRRFWRATPIRSPIDLKRGDWEVWTRRDVGRRCVTCCEPTFKQARLGARTRPTASMTGTRMLRSIINRWRGETPRRVPWLESTRRSESSPEPGSQAERRLNSTLSIPFILPLTMRGAVGYEPHASSRNSQERVAVLRRTSPSRAGKRLRAVRIFKTATGVACGSFNWTICLSLN